MTKIQPFCRYLVYNFLKQQRAMSKKEKKYHNSAEMKRKQDDISFVNDGYFLLSSSLYIIKIEFCIRSLYWNNEEKEKQLIPKILSGITELNRWEYMARADN